MRILVLSNFYPPARSGGYTQWCFEVAEMLKTRGHQIEVITSSHESEKCSFDEPGIHRVLSLEGDLLYYRPLDFFTRWKGNTRRNLVQFEKVVDKFEPDVIFVWGMWALSRRLPKLAEELMPAGVVYYLSDYWPSASDMHSAFWRSVANKWHKKFFKRSFGELILSLQGVRDPELKFDHAICVSAAVRNILIGNGVPLENSRVIHGGTDLGRFRFQERTFSFPLRLLYAGQLVPHKGVHTAIAAMKELRDSSSVQLSIVGSGHPNYEAELKHVVAREGLQSSVTFLSPRAGDQMGDLLNDFDVLVFPSIYEEPLARMTQEAMASGLVVVGTPTGGTAEILDHEVNGLIFEPEDPESLVRQIRRLLTDAAMLKRLSIAGRQTVEGHFNLIRMVNEIEEYLEVVVQSNACPPEGTASTDSSSSAHSLSH